MRKSTSDLPILITSESQLLTLIEMGYGNSSSVSIDDNNTNYGEFSSSNTDNAPSTAVNASDKKNGAKKNIGMKRTAEENAGVNEKTKIESKIEIEQQHVRSNHTTMNNA